MVASAPVVRTGSGPWTHQGEPLALALHRLAAKGHDEDLVILDDVGVAPFACRVTSSRPGHFPYVVTIAPGPLHGCDCEGYARHQRCKHYCLALEAAGWLPDVELLAAGDGKELDDHELWDAAVASAAVPTPIALMSRADRRRVAAESFAAREQVA
jgi:hypothetical protein